MLLQVDDIYARSLHPSSHSGTNRSRRQRRSSIPSTAGVSVGIANFDEYEWHDHVNQDGAPAYSSARQSVVSDLDGNFYTNTAVSEMDFESPYTYTL